MSFTSIKTKIDELQPTKAVFSLTLNGDGDSIRLRPEARTIPKIGENDIELKLIYSHFEEGFSSTSLEFYINKSGIIAGIQNTIRSALTKFVRQNIGMKNPKQSKLYRSLTRSMPRTPEFDDFALALYKYMLTFCNEFDFKAANGNDKHVQNVLILLESMMEKYSERK